MVLYTIIYKLYTNIYKYIQIYKNLWPIKDILKTLSFSGVNNCIKITKDSVLEKQQ